MKYIEDRLKAGVVIAFIMMVLSLTLGLFSCKKDSKTESPKDPTNYSEMFSALGLQFNKEYRFEEWHTYSENGTGWEFTNRSGTIQFNITDTSMIENYKGYIMKDGFRLSNFSADHCSFENLGYKKYDTAKSVFINTAWQNLRIYQGQAYVGWATKYGGVYSAYNLRIIK
jgi:hypothetical protein